jgi:MSHA pilin protein MshA
MRQEDKMKEQAGFTLIELIIVIVILGLLSAVAIPKFVDLSDDAEDAAIEGIAGGLSSASTINYATEKTNPTTGTAVGNCVDVGALVEGGASGAPATGYTIASLTTGLTVEGGSNSNCVLTHTASGKTRNFTAIGVN